MGKQKSGEHRRPVVHSSSRHGYDVSVSRGRYDAQLYTNDAATLAQALSRDVSHSPAIQQEPVAHEIESQTTHTK
jgi:hypothetical protein